MDNLDKIDDIVLILPLLVSGDRLYLVPHCLTTLYPCEGIVSLHPVPHGGESVDILLYLVFVNIGVHHNF